MLGKVVTCLRLILNDYPPLSNNARRTVQPMVLLQQHEHELKLTSPILPFLT